MKFNLSFAIYVLVLLIPVVFCSSLEEKTSFRGNGHYDISIDSHYTSFDERSSVNNEDIESGPNNLESEASDNVALINQNLYSYPELVLIIHKFSLVSMVALSFGLGALLIPGGATVVGYLIVFLHSLINVAKYSLDVSSQLSVPLKYDSSTFTGRCLNNLRSSLPGFKGFIVSVMVTLCGFASFLKYHEDISISMITFASLFFVFSVLNYILERN